MPITRIQLRRGTAAEWSSVNPILASGELGLETDTGKVKAGNGSSVWTALPYAGVVGPAGPQGPAGPPGTTIHSALSGLGADDHTLYLRADGARQLAGNLAVAASITIDGRDLSADGVKLDALWGAPVAVTDAATIALNAALGSTFRVTLAGNRTLGVPTNPTDGQSITLEITQDGTGGRTLTLASGTGGFAFGTDATMALWQLSTSANAVDVATFKYRVISQRWLVLGLMRGY
jgi:hypothetical protein